MTQETILNAPWSLHLDRDGSEDVAIICDSNGEELVRSRGLWLPEGSDPIPPTLAAMQLMIAAPKLLEAAKATLTAFELILEVNGSAEFTQAELESEPLSTLRGAAIVDAESGE